MPVPTNCDEDESVVETSLFYWYYWYCEEQKENYSFLKEVSIICNNNVYITCSHVNVHDT